MRCSDRNVDHVRQALHFDRKWAVGGSLSEGAGGVGAPTLCCAIAQLSTGTTRESYDARQIADNNRHSAAVRG